MAHFIEQSNKIDAEHGEVIISSAMKVVDLKGNGRFDCNSKPETALLLEQRMITLSKFFPVAKSFLRNFAAVSVLFRNPATNL